MPPEATTSTPTPAQGESVQSELSSLIAAQGISEIPDADLRGEDDVPAMSTDEPPADDDTSKVDSPPTDAPPAVDDTKTEGDPTDVPPASSEPQGKTPKGFVPLAAIHEARGEIRALKEQIAALTAAKQPTPPATSEAPEVPTVPEFEVLSDAAFEELAEDNPAQAAVYLRKLALHQEAVRAAEAAKVSQESFKVAIDRIIDSSVEAMEKVAPGIFAEDGAVRSELMEFGNTLGFTEDLYYLTNPSTKIILPGESEPLLLGEQAASILGLLVNAKAKLAPPTDEAALRERITAEVTAELMKKFKTAGQTGSTYRGLNEVSRSGHDIPQESLKDKVLTAEQLAKLSPEAYEAYLMGN